MKTLIAALAAGSSVALIAVVVICLVGLLVASCFGIFFSGEDSGTGMTMPIVIREINEEYEARLEEIKTSTPHDILEMSGSRAVWPDVLSIYSVKTTNDPNNAQEVATMDEGKKAILTDIFWDMHDIRSWTETDTSTITVETEGEDGSIVEEEVETTTTTLYITVGHKGVDEMASMYGFTPEQRSQLTELLSDEAEYVEFCPVRHRHWRRRYCHCGAIPNRECGRRPLLVLVRLRLPSGLVRLFCLMVRQRVRVYRGRNHPQVCRLLHWLPVVF